MMYRLAWMAPLLAAGLAAAANAAEPAPRIAVLDSIDAPAQGADGYRIEELSGLAWDEDERLLYAVSDTGVLHQFRLRLDGDRLAGIEPVFSAALSAADGAALAASDAEDVAVVNGANGKPGDSALLIALEDGPAVARFTPQGKLIGEVALPAALADKALYAKKNRRLESVAFDPRHGVVTAPETPQVNQPGDLHTLYAEDGTTWSFKAFQPKGSSLKAMDLTADGHALVLERTREHKGAPFMARLRSIDLAGCAADTPCSVTELTPAVDAPLNDNYEGMARLPGDLVLLVTDKAAKDGEPTKFTLVALHPAS